MAQGFAPHASKASRKTPTTGQNVILPDKQLPPVKFALMAASEVVDPARHAIRPVKPVQEVALVTAVDVLQVSSPSVELVCLRTIMGYARART
jgi:hypothetical protein